MCLYMYIWSSNQYPSLLPVLLESYNIYISFILSAQKLQNWLVRRFNLHWQNYTVDWHPVKKQMRELTTVGDIPVMQVTVLFAALQKTDEKPLSHVWLFATLWTVHMEFSRPEYWSGQPFPSPEDLLNPRIKSRSPELQADFLPAEP